MDVLIEINERKTFKDPDNKDQKAEQIDFSVEYDGEKHNGRCIINYDYWDSPNKSHKFIMVAGTKYGTTRQEIYWSEEFYNDVGLKGVLSESYLSLLRIGIKEQKRFRESIEAKMIAEHYKDLSDGEIDRCLGNCVAANILIPMAKILRDKNKLFEDDQANN